MAEPGRTELTVASDGVAPSRAELGVLVPTPVLVVSGTTATLEPDVVQRLLPVLKAVVDVAAGRGAVIVTGGTDAGVFHVFGLAVESSQQRLHEIGVAPDGLLASAATPAWVTEGEPIDPRLSVLVRVEGDQWGDETVVLSRVVSEVAGWEPAAVLLVGGGEVSRAELVEHLRRGRPVVVLRGSARLADEVASGLRDEPDADLRALVKAGEVRVVPLRSRRRAARAVKGALKKPRQPRRARWAALSVFPRWPYRPGPVGSLVDPDARLRFPHLADRIAEADQLIYPVFAECDTQALIEQNRYRWFAVLAIFGGLLTTGFGALQAWLQSARWPGVVVATLGAATTALNTVAHRQGSLDQYLTSRQRAERLRSLYFQHIATPPAADGATDAIERDVETKVANIRYGKASV